MNETTTLLTFLPFSFFYRKKESHEDAQPSASSPATSKPEVSTSTQTSTSKQTEPEKTLASPATRHLAAKHRIKFSDVDSRRKDGRITKEDVEKTIKQQQQPPQPPQEQALPQQQSPKITLPPIEVADKVVPLSGYARAMFKSMTAANAIPHFGYSDEVEVDELIRAREALKPLANARGVKLTYMPFILKATSMALREFPRLNSQYDEKQHSLIYKASHNIGIAVDTPLGLVVPNVKNVQNLSVFEIAVELARLIDGAKKGTLKASDLTGGTISISNVGNIGGTYTSPVLVVPEVVIGALGSIKKLPRFDRNNQIRAANVLIVSWSADHRVIDGVTVASFSNLWKQYLEHPYSFLLDLK